MSSEIHHNSLDIRASQAHSLLVMRFPSRISESAASADPNHTSTNALTLHHEMPVLEEKGDLSFFERTIKNKRRLVIGAGIGLAVVACVGVVLGANHGINKSSLSAGQVLLNLSSHAHSTS